MSKNQVRGGEQKAFVKLFDSICQWNSRWERWNDMVKLFAIEISNPVDAFHRESRNRTYAAIAQKYKPEEFQRFVPLLVELVKNYEQNPFQDFLGAMYMDLELGSSQNGQFFTPYNICQMMAEVSISDDVNDRIAERGWVSLHDPTCGGGATLIGAAEALYRRGINYQERALFVGQDLDATVALMCYIQLSLIGCAGCVRIGNTLMHPPTGDVLIRDTSSEVWYTPMYFSALWQGRVIARQMDLLARASGGRVAHATAEGAAAVLEAEPERVTKPVKKKAEREVTGIVRNTGDKSGGRTIQISLFDE